MHLTVHYLRLPMTMMRRRRDRAEGDKPEVISRTRQRRKRRKGMKESGCVTRSGLGDGGERGGGSSFSPGVAGKVTVIYVAVGSLASCLIKVVLLDRGRAAKLLTRKFSPAASPRLRSPFSSTRRRRCRRRRHGGGDAPSAGKWPER